jgi:hypothetical protein
VAIRERGPVVGVGQVSGGLMAELLCARYAFPPPKLPFWFTPVAGTLPNGVQL